MKYHSAMEQASEPKDTLQRMSAAERQHFDAILEEAVDLIHQRDQSKRSVLVIAADETSNGGEADLS